jgi:hypothetical protein
MEATPNPFLGTSSQRLATGLDSGARTLILGVLATSGFGPVEIVEALFADRYGSRTDYYAALGQVWGEAVGYHCQQAVSSAEVEAEFPLDFGTRARRATPQEVGAHVLLMRMPESDFRLAVEEVVSRSVQPQAAGERITKICRSRGAPWVFDGDGFQWVGDAELEAAAIRPALSAIEDPRLVSAKGHFESARSELALGTLSALSQSVHQSACAVESALKAVLKHRGVTYDEKDAAFKLFDLLVAGNIVPEFMRFCVLAAASPRNKVGGHGADEAPHDVPQEMAEAVLTSAAVAIAYLHKLLP